MAKHKDDLLRATVTEALPETRFRVVYDDGTEGIVYLAGKMKRFRIRVLVGDSVGIHPDDYEGKAKGRIEQRYKQEPKRQSAPDQDQKLAA